VSVALPSLPPDDAPENLAALWPLVLRWAESDDQRRGQLIAVAPEHDLQDLVDRLRPTFDSINAYLDRTADAERAVPFGDLAQSALEAEQVLDGRT
jgi:hypothetical protein